MEDVRKFTYFKTGTVARSTEIMKNYYYFGGDRQPYTQSADGTLTAVDSTYDLGSAANKWNYVYCQTLNVNTDITSSTYGRWIKETALIMSGATSRIEITGLQGDNAKVYKIVMSTKYATPITTTSYNLVLGGTAGADSASNYSFNRYIAHSGTIDTAIGSTTYITLAIATNTVATAASVYCEMILYAETGRSRPYLIKYGDDIHDNYIYSYVHRCGDWNNTTTSITTMVFYDSANSGTGFGIGSTLEIWRRNY